METELKEKGVQFESEMAALRTHAAAVEEEVEEARRQYDLLQESYRNSVSMLEARLLEITGLLSSQKLSNTNEIQLKHKENICNGEITENAPDLSVSPPEESNLAENKESSQNSESNKMNPTSDPMSESGGSGKRKRNRKKKRSLART